MPVSLVRDRQKPGIGTPDYKCSKEKLENPMLKNLNKFTALLFGSLLASAGTVIGAPIISDTFTGTNGTLLTAHTPGTNLPGGSWYHYSDIWPGGTISDNTAFLSTSAVAFIGIASNGGYTKPDTMTISADIKVGNVDGAFYQGPRGVGIGFTNTTPANVGNFKGLVLRPDGFLQLMTSNSSTESAKVASGISGFNGNTFYNLSYTINTTTAAITSITLAGSSANFSSIVSDSTGVFTNTNTQYAGIRVAADNGNKSGYADNFVVAIVPEPATIGLLGLGAVGLLSRRRRMA